MSEELERMAEVFHRAWMFWANNIMETEVISPEREKRWRTYMVPYSELSEKVKDQDREWARLAMFDPNKNPN